MLLQVTMEANSGHNHLVSGSTFQSHQAYTQQSSAVLEKGIFSPIEHKFAARVSTDSHT